MEEEVREVTNGKEDREELVCSSAFEPRRELLLRAEEETLEAILINKEKNLHEGKKGENIIIYKTQKGGDTTVGGKRGEKQRRDKVFVLEKC